MPRPKPEIYNVTFVQGLEHQIVSCPGIYAVFYEGKPFNLRDQTPTGWKYRHSVFLHPGQAHHLVKKLNEKYDTDKFTFEVIYDQNTE